MIPSEIPPETPQVIPRMSGAIAEALSPAFSEKITDPNLLLDLIANPHFNTFTDNFLGFSKFGACTGHWIEAKGNRQLSHVDYPIHVGSGPFWQHSVDRLQRFVTRHQINKIFPYFSVQVLAAADAMDVSNGSTEVVPCSHAVEDIDLLIHDEEVYRG